MRPRLVGMLILACTLSLAASAAAQEVLTNESVIAMKRAGFSDAVILAKIRNSQSKFDVTTRGLLTLKESGVSDQVIEAMLGHGAPGATASPPVATPVSPGGTAIRGAPPGREGVFHVRGEQYVELAAAVASLETNVAFFQSKSEIVLRGRRAAYRLDDRRPVFLSPWPPNEAPLVRLKPGDDHDDRNLKFSSGAFMPFGGTVKQGVRTQDVIDVEAERDQRGFYRITPRRSLAPGEYGFVVTHGFAGAAGGGKIFDFGVD